MRKILIFVLIILLLVSGYMVIFKGLNVLGADILSIEQIKMKNDELDNKLQKISTLTSVDYPKAIQDLEDSAKKLTIAKDEYNNKILNSSSENIEAATQTRPYETEYLMITLGNHAKKNKINLRYELRQASSGATKEYDINFTITGSYVSISEFVSSIENDSSLSFKIENFKLNPDSGNTETLQATFVVRGINIKVDNVTTQSSAEENENTDTNQKTNS